LRAAFAASRPDAFGNLVSARRATPPADTPSDDDEATNLYGGVPQQPERCGVEHRVGRKTGPDGMSQVAAKFDCRQRSWKLWIKR